MPDLLTAHVRRLAKDGKVLYIQFAADDVRRLQLQHSEGVEVAVGSVTLPGIVKTSGTSNWLAPSELSNAEMTSGLRTAGFGHGGEVTARIRRLGPPGSDSSVRTICGRRAVLEAAVVRFDEEAAIAAV